MSEIVKFKKGSMAEQFFKEDMDEQLKMLTDFFANGEKKVYEIYSVLGKTLEKLDVLENNEEYRIRFKVFLEKSVNLLKELRK